MAAEDEGGCAPRYRALVEAARVELRGTGDTEVLIVTDPLCWHCRLGHKLVGEYPDLYGRVKVLFLPGRSFLGSDMAAWVIEDVAGTDRLKPLLDFAYRDLRQPKVSDLDEARMLILAQFTAAFPDMLEGTTLPDLFLRLAKEHGPRVAAGAELARAAQLPGTPILIAGDTIVMGYGPEAWLEALAAKSVCP
ncbi:hypothetical protein GKC30_01845 [Pseudodesulfovibrio sp. F-1]|uniref:Thioredoxin-like fold domain-containing protein n=2 Tax=Pseudodesulfovibrio alkaliphilus TaxID=2661613 RepID=A0A7K1KKF3_9BACT|nr:hypothetical protein [Pseudodesulfovibrio alkaliphilus]